MVLYILLAKCKKASEIMKLKFLASEIVLPMPLEMPSFINHFVVSSSYIHLLPQMDVSTAKKDATPKVYLQWIALRLSN
jgi:hypothetical protein